MPSLSTGKCYFLLFLLLGIQATGWAAGTQPLRKADSPDMRSSIQLQVREGIDVGDGKPGFRLALSGWPPNTVLDVYALDADGTRVPLVSGATTDAAGAAVVAIPYESDGLHPGPWIIGVSSKNLNRGERLLVPRVIRGKRGWRLEFKSSGRVQPGEVPQ